MFLCDGGAPRVSTQPDPAPAAAPAAYDGRALLRFACFLLATLILTSRLATALHEAVGHALVGAALGAEVREIHVSLFAGGRTAYGFGEGAGGTVARALAALGGIAVNLLTGLGALALARRLDRHPAASLVAALFAAVSLLGAIAYATLGGYYGEGDPVAWMDDRSAGNPIWIPCLIAAPAACYLAARPYLAIQERAFPAATPLRRLAVGLATLGAASAAYAGLYALEAEPFAAARASEAAHRRAMEETRGRKREERLARLRAERPELSEAELRREVERTPIPVRPDEAPAKFPLLPLLAIAFAGGGVAALWRTQPRAAEPAALPSFRAVAMSLALAALALAGLAAIR
jgi:hypothetical protein